MPRVARTATGLTHRNMLVLRRVRIIFQRYPGTAGSDADRGIAGVPYRLLISGRLVRTGTTATDGTVELEIPVGSDAVLEAFGSQYQIRLVPYLHPVNTTRGGQRRLSILGYELGTADGVYARRTEDAAMNFQADQAVNPTGVVGTTTRDRLRTQVGE